MGRRLLDVLAREIFGFEITLEELLLASAAFLTGAGAFLSAFASVVTSFSKGAETATQAAAAVKGSG